MTIHYLASIKPSAATGPIKKVYQELEREMGDVVEPIALHAIIPSLLEGTWGMLRETLLVDDQLNRSTKEAIASSVSVSNKCTYCVDAHTIMLIGLNDKKIAKAIMKEDPDEIEDDFTKSIVKWALNTKKFNSPIIENPTFNYQCAPEAIGTAVFFHYLNRVVTIFLGPTILPMNINFLKGMMKEVAAKMFSKVLAMEKKEGHYLKKDSKYKLLNWAKGNERIYFYYHSYYEAINEEIRKYFPDEVCDLILLQIIKWDGSDRLNLKELEKIVQRLSPRMRPIGRILFYVCFTPFKVQDFHIEQFHLLYPGGDRALLAAVAWASFMTSCKIGRELGLPFQAKEAPEFSKQSH